MKHSAKQILAILDACCASLAFPMLDNGYVYPAATRLSLHRSEEDWALVIEVFGFSPRSGLPDTQVYTFASRLRDRKANFVSTAAHERYLASNPNNESRFVFPVAEGEWQDASELEFVAEAAEAVDLRGQPVRIPPREEYARNGIELADPRRVQVFELCRYLAAVARDSVLATAVEQQVNVPDDLTRLMQVEEWHHPEVADETIRPSGSEAFQQFAMVLETGDVSLYRPTRAPNTHWRNWPDGGTL